MEEARYKMLSNYLNTGTLPRVYPSTKSNFISEAKKFSLNGKNRLVRDGRIVLKQRELDETYEQLHQHSGRDKHTLNFESDSGLKVCLRGLEKKLETAFPAQTKTICNGQLIVAP